MDEFPKEEEQRDQARMQIIKQEREAKEKAQGMSAAAAKRDLPSQRKPVSSKHDVIEPLEEDPSPPEILPTTKGSSQGLDRTDLLLDGKVVKASYNMEIQERFVHVTHTQVDADGNRHRHIVGAQETKLDRNEEWGAALSV